MNNIEILKRLYNEYTKKFLPKILLSVFFSLISCWKYFCNCMVIRSCNKKNIYRKRSNFNIYYSCLQLFLHLQLKGVSLYFAKTILIKVGQEVTKILQFQL